MMFESKVYSWPEDRGNLSLMFNEPQMRCFNDVVNIQLNILSEQSCLNYHR